MGGVVLPYTQARAEPRGDDAVIWRGQPREDGDFFIWGSPIRTLSVAEAESGLIEVLLLQDYQLDGTTADDVSRS